MISDYVPISLCIEATFTRPRPVKLLRPRPLSLPKIHLKIFFVVIFVQSFKIFYHFLDILLLRYVLKWNPLHYRLQGPGAICSLAPLLGDPYNKMFSGITLYFLFHSFKKCFNFQVQITEISL